MAIELTCGKPLPNRVSKADPKYRREERKAGPCVRTVFENGAPVATTVVAAPAPAAPKPTAADGSKVISSTVWVTVEGKTTIHSSTRVAFAALGLPDNKHVKFRAQLKRAGAHTFEHGGKAYAFEARIPTSGSAA